MLLLKNSEGYSYKGHNEKVYIKGIDSKKMSETYKTNNKGD